MRFWKRPANVEPEVKQSAQSLAWQLVYLTRAMASFDQPRASMVRIGSISASPVELRKEFNTLIEQLWMVGCQPMPGQSIRDLLLRANAAVEQLAALLLKLTRQLQRARHARRARHQDTTQIKLMELTVAGLAATRETLQTQRKVLQTQRKWLQKLSWPETMFSTILATASLPPDKPARELEASFAENKAAVAMASPAHVPIRAAAHPQR